MPKSLPRHIVVPALGIGLLELVGADPLVSFSPHCWKIKMALAHKGLIATQIPVRFHDLQQIDGPALRAPVLVDERKVITDSWAIAVYLDAQYPTRHSLLGQHLLTFFTRAINVWVDEIVLPVMAKVLSKAIWHAIAPIDRPYYRRSREERFGTTLETIWAERPAHLAALRDRLDPLREKVLASPFIGGIIEGTDPRYADYCAFAPFMWARAVGSADLLEKGDPILPWLDRMLGAFGGIARTAPIAAGGAVDV